MTATSITPDVAETIASADQPVVVVTGASSGIGAEIAVDLSADRVVIAVGRDERRLDEVVARGREGAIIPVQLDLADLESIESALTELPRVDAVVHAAALLHHTTAETTPDVWRRMLEVNVIAPAELTRVLLPALRDARGTIVLIGSGASRRAAANHIVYAATKHALQAYADGIRAELEPDGVRVSTVSPGPTATRGALGAEDQPLDEAAARIRIAPETVARSVRHVLDAPADAQLTEVWVRPRTELR
ncbi:SDR family NAD(P)-dependent oxidoreductase [Microbacterium gorillae]|uniref:SDR family NAD(P)-dependent oxidoreductase n=1 Tax=Microbacterium gorillae TaxID=1231063 RepID=UPI00059047D4|nr:SDR family NAD(P)-dependent oxidoreductase [Microbacterium gorillae]